MKKAILFFFLLPSISFAQQEERPVKKHELGVNLFSVKRFDRYKNFSDCPVISADLNILTGLYYKNHFGKNAWRASVDYSHRSIQKGWGEPLDDPYTTTQYYSAKRTNFSIAAGYEHSFGSRKFQPYLFSDLVFNYQNLTGSRINIGCFGPYGMEDFSEEVFEYGVAAGAGFKYQFIPSLSFSFEMSAEGFVSMYQDVLNAGDKYRNVGFHVNPVNKLGLAFEERLVVGRKRAGGRDRLDIL